MIVKQLELAQVDESIQACYLADLLMIKNYFFNLSLPWALLSVNHDPSSGRFIFSLCSALRHLIVLLLCLQVICDHLGVHFDITLVDFGRVFVANLKSIKLLQTWQPFENVCAIVWFCRCRVALEAKLLKVPAILGDMVKLAKIIYPIVPQIQMYKLWLALHTLDLPYEIVVQI